jgi:eukaryotic-like serine/threonine-protein kinase
MNSVNSLCPPADIIAAFAFGELEADSAAPVQSHVSMCEACLATVGHLAASRASSSSKVGESESTDSDTVMASPGQQIGAYRLVRRLGEGGMGEVWECDQHTPVRRTVALKLLKPGMNTRQILARFAAERQMLALMQHPSIAQVFDAGVTSTGRPYFVMEYVNGTRVTTYCDQAGLGVRERLALFQDVCNAVQHAHQKGVIHRDIKPSNVLVTLQDGQALPKVIDFGLAKLTAPELTDHTLTEMGTVLGTPAYASPEQMSLSGMDVDTRSDVYSLGVLLYELLIGVIPFDTVDAQPAAILELRRSIRDVEPTRPSARLSKLGERVSLIAQARGLDVGSLRRQLRGDLDWIVMKALEKDRSRRYNSPGELARDTQRYLDHEPVAAGPPTNAYRVRKFVRRHRAATAFSATLLLLIVAFAVVSAIQVQRVSVERDRASAEAAKAASINTFLQDALGSADPWQTGAGISMQTVLQQASAKADASFKDQPLIAAAVHRTIGKAYLGLGQFADAEREVRVALDQRVKLLGPEHADVAECLLDLSRIYQELGNFEAARKASSEALAMRRKLFGEEEPRTAETLLDRARLHKREGEYDAANGAANEALAIYEKALGSTSESVAEVLTELGSIAADGQGDPQRGEGPTRRAYEIRQQLHGASDVRTAQSAVFLGSIYLHQGKLDRAEALYRQGLEQMTKQLGANHPDTIVVLENLGNALARQKRFDESSAITKDVLERRRAVLGEDHRLVARTMLNTAILLSAARRLDEAQVQFAEALPRFAKAYGPDHPDVVYANYAYAALRARQREYADAERLLKATLASQIKQSGVDHVATAEMKRALGDILIERRKFDEAERILLEARSAMLKSFDASSAEVSEVDDTLKKLADARQRKQ